MTLRGKEGGDHIVVGDLLEVLKENGSRLHNSQTAGLTFSLFKNVTELFGNQSNMKQGKKDLL